MVLNDKNLDFNHNSGDLKSGVFEGRILNGRALAMTIVSTIPKPDHSKSGCFGPDYKWFWQNGDICPDFKWLGFRISDTIKNPDHLQPDLFLPIQNPD